jgi:SAM-dependent methyltransferase
VQAGWTRDIRLHLYARTGLNKARRVLEVGCGTGVLTNELSRTTRARVSGLDLNPDFLALARHRDRKTHYTLGDGNLLPYPGGAFDLTLCHFLLLWVKNPLQVLLEMKRVTRPGRAVLALAEPDYGGRIDYPASLAELGQLQTEGLRRTGANPLMGRELAGLFARAGYNNVETGVLGGEWRHSLPARERDSEWATLQADLAGQVSPDHLAELSAIEQSAYASRERVLYVPTFYAVGWVR